MGGFQIWHWIVIAVVGAILFFGWKQLPDMARSVGRSLRVFKTEIKGLNEDDDKREQARSESAERETPQVEQTPQPKQIAPVQRPVPQAQVVRNPAASSAAASAGEPARSRPRPTPSPNGRAAR